MGYHTPKTPARSLVWRLENVTVAERSRDQVVKMEVRRGRAQHVPGGTSRHLYSRNWGCAM